VPKQLILIYPEAEGDNPRYGVIVRVVLGPHGPSEWWELCMIWELGQDEHRELTTVICLTEGTKLHEVNGSASEEPYKLAVSGEMGVECTGGCRGRIGSGAAGDSVPSSGDRLSTDGRY
jgi:hypothetical protein